jgi:hypothetical protein
MVPIATASVAEVLVDQFPSCWIFGNLDAQVTPNMTNTAPTHVNIDPALMTNEVTFSRSSSATNTPATNSHARVKGE